MARSPMGGPTTIELIAAPIGMQPGGYLNKAYAGRDQKVVTPTLELQGNYGPEATLLAPGQGVVRMRFQTGIMNYPHGRVRGKHPGNGLGILFVTSQSCMQGAQAPQNLAAVERRCGRTHAVGPPGQVFQQG